MAQRKTEFRCIDCGGSTPKWVGRCPACDAWNTLVEEVVVPGWVGGSAGALRDVPEPLDEIPTILWAPRSTGVDEFDRVVGGGLVPASVTLVGGEPGIGKSTLLMQIAAGRPGPGRTLYVTGEESKQQVRQRAERLGLISPLVHLVAETSVDAVIAHIESLEPEMVVVDSVQTLHDPALSSAAGSVGQVRHVSARLVRVAKERGTAIVLVGHVTKEGALAGPRVLEHLVDTVLEFSGDRHQGLRMLRAVKHRFGTTGELGLFEMGESGLTPLADASTTFLADRVRNAPGSVVAATIEGQRPLLVELQSLLAPTNRESGPGARVAPGLDSGRLAVVLAVLDQHVGVVTLGSDVYLSLAGGARVREPGLDLPLALAIASALRQRPLAHDLVAVGEIGLAGEVRQVGRLERRLAEASRLGFHGAVVPAGTPDLPVGLHLHRVATVAEAVEVVGLGPVRSRRAAA